MYNFICDSSCQNNKTETVVCAIHITQFQDFVTNKYTVCILFIMFITVAVL